MNTDKEMLQEALLQLEYLHKKFTPTGTGASVISRIQAHLSLPTEPAKTCLCVFQRPEIAIADNYPVHSKKEEGDAESAESILSRIINDHPFQGFEEEQEKMAIEAMEEYANQYRTLSAGKGEGVWVKASDKLPDLYDSHSYHYQLDYRKVDGHFINSEKFEYYDPEICGYKQIEKNEFARIEWLDEAKISSIWNNWVSVEEGNKPSFRIKVLIQSKWGIDFGYYDTDSVFKFSDGNYDLVKDSDITHWRNLPEPPNDLSTLPKGDAEEGNHCYNHGKYSGDKCPKCSLRVEF